MEDKIYRVKAGGAFLATDETRNGLTNELFNPNGGVTVDIVNPNGTVVVDGEAMLAVSTGIWKASILTLADWVPGMYAMITYALHDGMPSIKENKNAFELY